MKQNDFDNLLRSKFEENDFEYKPGNWDKLAEQLDDRPGKRKTFLWVPMAIIASTASIAASLAMIISIPVLMHHKTAATYASIAPKADVKAKNNIISIQDAPAAPALAVNMPLANNLEKTILTQVNTKKDNSLSLRANFNAKDLPGKSANELLAFNAYAIANDKNILSADGSSKYPVYRTFNSEQNDRVKTKMKTSVSIAGGLNYGNAISGYTIGATGKRMLGDKLYIESDLAFVSNSTTERTEYWPVANVTESRVATSRMISNDMGTPTGSAAQGGGSTPAGVASTTTPTMSFSSARMALSASGTYSPVTASNAVTVSNRPQGMVMSQPSPRSGASRYANAKMTSSDGGGNGKVSETNTIAATPSAQVKNINYDLYYAQVTPTIGYNIHKKISVGVGADVQRLLMNDKATANGSDLAQQSGNEIPAFDFGFVGKTECALSNKIKAGISYRQGLNNLVNPSAKYLDRNYLQVQLKFMLLRK